MTEYQWYLRAFWCGLMGTSAIGFSETSSLRFEAAVALGMRDAVAIKGEISSCYRYPSTASTLEAELNSLGLGVSQ